MRTSQLGRWATALGIALMLTVGPYVYYRNTYTYAKRLRPIAAGKVYRSGCMTTEGFRDAIQKYKIRTVINLMEENPDPELSESYFNTARRTKESELCKSLGAQLTFILVDLVPNDKIAKERPATIEQFLAIMDDPASYPVLIHCKAGLHRTGVLSAVYRMEYEGWSRLEAWRELRSHGFGDFVSDITNDYVAQYVLNYQPGLRRSGAQADAGRVVPARPVALRRQP